MTQLPFADLHDLPEDARIDIIGPLAAGGKDIAFIVDDDLKADRYIAKLTSRYAVRVVWRGPGPEGLVLVRVGPKGDA